MKNQKIYTSVLLFLLLTSSIFTGCDDFPPLGDSAEVRANFEVSSVECVSPCEVTFTNLSENADRYEWDFGDGTTSIEEHPIHTFIGYGTRVVTLTAFDGDDTSEHDEAIFVDTGGEDGPMIVQTYSSALNSIGLDVTKIDGLIYVAAQGSNEGSAFFSNVIQNDLVVFADNGEFKQSFSLPKEWSIYDLETDGSVLFIAGESLGNGFIAKVNPGTGEIISTFEFGDAIRKIAMVDGTRPFIIGHYYDLDSDNLIYSQLNNNLESVYEVIDFKVEDTKGIDCAFDGSHVYLLSTLTSDSGKTSQIEVIEKAFGYPATSATINGFATGFTVDNSIVYTTYITPTEDASVMDLREFTSDGFTSFGGVTIHSGETYKYPTNIVRSGEKSLISSSSLTGDDPVCTAATSFKSIINFGGTDFDYELDCRDYDNRGFYIINSIFDEDEFYAVGVSFTDEEQEKVALIIDDGNF